MKRLINWWRYRRVVNNSGINVYASRKTTLPLEDCDADALRTAARFNERKARVQARSRKQNHEAHRQWNLVAASALNSLASQLKKGQKVRDIKPRKRRRAVDALIRIERARSIK